MCCEPAASLKHPGPSHSWKFLNSDPLLPPKILLEYAIPSLNACEALIGSYFISSKKCEKLSRAQRQLALTCLAMGDVLARNQWHNPFCSVLQYTLTFNPHGHCSFGAKLVLAQNMCITCAWEITFTNSELYCVWHLLRYRGYTEFSYSFDISAEAPWEFGSQPDITQKMTFLPIKI